MVCAKSVDFVARLPGYKGQDSDARASGLAELACSSSRPGLRLDPFQHNVNDDDQVAERIDGTGGVTYKVELARGQPVSHALAVALCLGIICPLALVVQVQCLKHCIIEGLIVRPVKGRVQGETKKWMKNKSWHFKHWQHEVFGKQWISDFFVAFERIDAEMIAGHAGDISIPYGVCQVPRLRSQTAGVYWTGFRCTWVRACRARSFEQQARTPIPEVLRRAGGPS